MAETFLQRLEVQHRPPDEQRNIAARMDLGQRLAGILAEASGRVTIGGVEDIDQMMGRGRERLAIGFGGADVHVAVHLRRVDAYDFDLEARCQVHGNTGLPRCGGTHQQDRRRAILLRGFVIRDS